MSENPYLRKEGERVVVTEEGYRRLAEVVTDPEGQVYAFNSKLSPVIIAAAMARLSRRRGDMREIILDEFMDLDAYKAEALIRRVVSEYGDDSVQQLVGLHFVVEGASNLLTKLLEWGRVAAYLEQSTRYIYFDERDAEGKFSYYTPSNLEGGSRSFYVQTMNGIFERYSSMVRDITAYLRNKHEEPKDKRERVAWLNSTRAQACDAVRPVLPVATKSTVGIFASAQSVERLVMYLRSEYLPEARDVGQQILEQARKVIPVFLERADNPTQGNMISTVRSNNRYEIRKLAQKYLQYKPPFIPSSSEVKLVSYWPERELDIVPEILFEQAEPLSLEEIRRQVFDWDNIIKAKVFRAYMANRFNRRARPGRAFEIPHFEWEIVGDYGTFRDLQRHRMVDAFEWQRLSPLLGYEVPELVREVGFEGNFRECFELAEELYDEIISKDDSQAQYATLLGHRMRYRFITNLRESFHLIELRTGPAGHPGYRKICNQMFNKLEEVYPLSAEGMKFVNKGEDPELARLAAELATQNKLKKLDSSYKK